MPDSAEMRPHEQIEALTVPDGHTLHLTITGSRTSPILLLIPGSSGLCTVYRHLTLHLCSIFRTITYSKRGFLEPQSTTNPTPAPQPRAVQQHALDAAHIVRNLSPTKPVYVFGTSTGGTVALDLLIRYPDLVHTAILHEPIVFSLVADLQIRKAMVAEYRRVAAITDPFEALGEFARGYMFSSLRGSVSAKGNGRRQSLGQGQPQPAKAALLQQRDPLANHNACQTQLEASAMLNFEITREQIQGVDGRKIVLLGGVESSDMPVSVPGRGLADVLGTGGRTRTRKRVWEVAGGHASFASKKHAGAFCKTLLEVLEQEGRLEVAVDGRKQHPSKI